MDVDQPLKHPLKQGNQDLNWEGMLDTIAEASGRVSILEEAFASFKPQAPSSSKSGDSSAFKIAGYDLSQVQSVRLFLAQAGSSGKRADYFYDCFSMGNYCVCKDSEKKLKDRAAANRALVSSPVHDLSVTVAFDMDWPPQFGFSKDIVRAKSSKDPTFVLPLVKTFEDFYDPDPWRRRSVITTFEGYQLINSHFHALEMRAEG